MPANSPRIKHIAGTAVKRNPSQKTRKRKQPQDETRQHTLLHTLIKPRRPDLDQSLQAGLARRSKSCLLSSDDNPALLGIHHILCQMPKCQKPFVGVFHALVNLDNLVRADVHAMHTLDTSFWIR